MGQRERDAGEGQKGIGGGRGAEGGRREKKGMGKEMGRWGWTCGKRWREFDAERGMGQEENLISGKLTHTW